jgi:ataxia telangiectasia mutated family protein
VDVCTNFRPVMHYFFLEKFLQPADWFVKRLAYTRSVAASSMESIFTFDDIYPLSA